MVYLETFSDTKLVLQRKNKLKGMALESFVADSPKFQNEEIDESIQKIVKKANEYAENVYKVRKNFKLISEDKEIVFRTRTGHWDDYKMLFNFDQLNDCQYDIMAPTKTRDISLGYRKCSKCDNYEAKYKCEKCGGCVTEDLSLIYNLNKKVKEELGTDDFKRKGGEQKISNSSFIEDFRNIRRSVSYPQYCFCDDPKKSDKHTKRKCKYCKDGNFREKKLGISKGSFDVFKEDVSKEDLIGLLQENDYINVNEISEQISSKRVDYWTYDGEEIIINECKNNEKSKIGFREIIQACFYARALMSAGIDCNNVKIIYNGETRNNVDNYLWRLEEEWGLDINLVKLKKWCKDLDYFPKKIIIGKNVDGDNYGKNSEYNVDIVSSNSYVENPKLHIKTIP